MNLQRLASSKKLAISLHGRIFIVLRDIKRIYDVFLTSLQLDVVRLRVSVKLGVAVVNFLLYFLGSDSKLARFLLAIEADQVEVELVDVFAIFLAWAIDLNQKWELVFQVVLLVEKFMKVELLLRIIVECVPCLLNLFEVLLLSISLVEIHKSGEGL